MNNPREYTIGEIELSETEYEAMTPNELYDLIDRLSCSMDKIVITIK